MSRTHAATVIRPKVRKVLKGVLFTLGRYLDTTTDGSVTWQEICRNFQTPCSITYNCS